MTPNDNVTALTRNTAIPTTGLQVQTWDDMMRVSDFLAKSALIPQHLRGKPADIAITLMKGAELGLQPLQAIDSINVIQGTPSLKPEAQLAMIYAAMPSARMDIETDATKMTVTVTACRPGGNPQVFRWDMSRAKQMGLAARDNWVKQPLVMLKWRAVGEAARSVFPDVTRGLYNTEEAEDLGTQSANKPDKGAEIDALLKTSDVTVLPPETVPEPQTDVTKEEPLVVSTEVEPVETTISSPVADYRVPDYIHKAIGGKTLKEIGKAQCKTWAKNMRAAAEMNKRELKNGFLETVVRMEQYSEEPDGMFDDFNFDPVK